MKNNIMLVFIITVTALVSSAIAKADTAPPLQKPLSVCTFNNLITKTLTGSVQRAYSNGFVLGVYDSFSQTHHERALLITSNTAITKSRAAALLVKPCNVPMIDVVNNVLSENSKPRHGRDD